MFQHFWVGGNGGDTLDGGLGIDALAVNLSAVTTAVTINLTRSTNQVVGGNMVVNNFEQFTYLATGSGNDTFNLGSAAAQLNPFTSNGFIVDGGAGTDLLSANFSSVGDALFNGGFSDSSIGLYPPPSGGGIYLGYSGIERFNLTFGSGSDLLAGYQFDDTLNGGAGDDNIYGSGGNDFLDGGSDNDQLSGGDGNDVLIGGLGNDRLSGDDYGAGNDSLDGGAGNDSLYSGAGNDTLIGGDGDDDLDALNYFPGLSASSGLDSISAGAGNDTVAGNGGDILDGGLGTDTLALDLSAVTTAVTIDLTRSTNQVVGGNTVVNNFEQFTYFATGSGSDTFNLNNVPAQLNPYSYNVVLKGGAGNDTFNLGNAAAQVNPFTSYGFNVDGGAGTDLLSANFSSVSSELVNGGVSDSYIGIFGSGWIYLYYSGIERFNLTFGSGSDFLNGYEFDDTLNGGAGDDGVFGGGGNDRLTGGGGNDSITGYLGIDTLVESGNVNFTLTNTSLIGNGTDFLDTIEQAILTGGSGNNLISAAAFTLGSVTLNGGAGNDTLRGGSRNDTAVFGIVNNSVNLGSAPQDTGDGIDTLISIENLVGGAGDDSLTGSSGNNLLDGGTGNDSLDGGSGNDTLVGGADNDTLIGSMGNDSLVGGLGTDSLIGGIGNDQFIFDSGAALSVTLGIDTITAFSKLAGDTDRIVLDKSTFTSLTTSAGNPLAASEFAIVATDLAAGNSTARIIYNSTNGKLFYNPDGAIADLAGGGQFAQSSTGLALVSSDFLVRA